MMGPIVGLGLLLIIGVRRIIAMTVFLLLVLGFEHVYEQHHQPAAGAAGTQVSAARNSPRHR